MDDLARRHQQIQAEAAQIGIALPGSLTSRTTRCQRPGCPCRATPAVRHGPYPTWTRKAGARSITKTLTTQDAERLRPYFATHRRLRQPITELEAISIELAEQPETPKRRETSPLNPGTAPRQRPIIKGQRVLSLAQPRDSTAPAAVVFDQVGDR